MLRRLAGVALLVLAVAGLAGNEWRAGRADQALAALRAAVVTVDPSGLVPEDVPVLAGGEATAGAPLRDPPFAVSVMALRLDRQVEMLQWQERLAGSGQNRTVRHERVWSTELIDSSRFYDRAPLNPSRFPVAPLRILADAARLGRLTLSPEALAALPPSVVLRPTLGEVTIDGLRLAARLDGYGSGDPATPQIGDVRVRHLIVPPGPVTIVGSLRDGRLGPWPAPNGTAMLLADNGLRSLDELARARSLGRLPELWGARFAFGILALVATAALWADLAAAAPGLARALGGSRRRAAPLVALALVALAIALGWLLYRTPVGWP